MRLDELFDDSKPMTMADRLRQAALDILIPLKAHEVPFVTVQKVIDGLRQTRPGIQIDRSTIMDILDPSHCPAIEKIEGDRIYLAGAAEDDAQESAEQAKKDNIETVKQNAIKNAKQQVTKDAPA